MKLLFVVNSVIVGGAEKHTFDLAQSLSAKGFDCRIHALTASGVTPAFASGVAVTQPKSGGLDLILSLSRVIRDYAPDVVVGVNQRPLAAAFLARAIAFVRAPIVVVYHSTLLRNRKEERVQKIYRPFFHATKTIVWISENQRRYWLGQGMRPRSEVTILNGVDVTHFSPQARDRFREDGRRRWGLADGDFVLGYCAALRPEKNHGQLIAAVARLRAKGVRARALIVGDGPCRAALEQVAVENGVAEHVIFTGVQDDVRPCVSAFDVGVLTSTAIETLSLSALETMAMGIPVVLSDIGGATEIVTDRVEGGVFPSRDTDRLIECLGRLVDPSVRAEAASAARLKVERKFDERRMVDDYANFFHGLEAG